MIAWLKKNWALTVLILLALYWLKNNYLDINSRNLSYSPQPMMDSFSGGGIATSKMMVGFGSPAAPSDSANRLVIQDTSLSLQVKDVAVEIKTIETLTKGFGGFLVNSYLSKPESAASGNITVRVPESKRAEAMDSFKKLAVKVVSESVSGDDVTDQYVDLQAQLDVLNQTKAKYLEILAKAVNVSDLLNVQQQLTSLQQQIDSVKGQQKYFEQSAKLTKISIYLSTDELALPYAPTNEWRPAVIFKEAVRSLVGMFRNIGSLLIWGVVYIPIIIPVIGLIWFYKNRQSKVK
jgi:hypothetical protein